MTDNNDKVNDLDFDKVKQDIIETNKNAMEELKGSMLSTIMETVKSTLNEHVSKINVSAPNKSVTNSTLSEFKEEIDALGLDEDQGSALVKMMERMVTQKNSEIQDTVLKKVDKNLSDKDYVAALNYNTALQFPDVRNPRSELFKTTKKIYAELPAHIKALPDAEVIAVEKAALRLGVRPRSLQDANAWASQNPSGGDGTIKPAKQKEINPELAKFFGVDPKKVNEKLKEKGII